MPSILVDRGERINLAKRMQMQHRVHRARRRPIMFSVRTRDVQGVRWIRSVRAVLRQLEHNRSREHGRNRLHVCRRILWAERRRVQSLSSRRRLQGNHRISELQRMSCKFKHTVRGSNNSDGMQVRCWIHRSGRQRVPILWSRELQGHGWISQLCAVSSEHDHGRGRRYEHRRLSVRTGIDSRREWRMSGV